MTAASAASCIAAEKAERVAALAARPAAAARMRSLAPIGYDGDLRHHAPIFVFEDVAVIDEVAHLVEWDRNGHEGWFAGTGDPGTHSASQASPVACGRG